MARSLKAAGMTWPQSQRTSKRLRPPCAAHSRLSGRPEGVYWWAFSPLAGQSLPSRCTPTMTAEIF